MKNLNEIDDYFSKMKIFDFYKFEDEDDTWFFLNKEDSNKMTKLVLETTNLSFKFIVVGTNQNGNYILLKEDNKLINYDSNNFNTIDFELKFIDIISFKQ